MGYLCPKCGGELSYRLPCSHGYGYVTCVNVFKHTCDYSYGYRGTSATSLDMISKNFCPRCGRRLRIFYCNGEQTEYCDKDCGYITETIPIE